MFRSASLAVALLLCPSLDAQMMPFKNYGIKDGLNDNNVQAVIRDNRGLLWVGTDFGVNWFDGKKFYQPQIKANVGQLYVDGFYKDKKGIIWTLTFFNGLYKYQNGRFTNYLVDPLSKNATTNTVSEWRSCNPDLKFEVDGHTDNTGTPAHNLALSQQRSQAVMAQLIVMGIDPARLTSKGFGDTKPIADNTSLDGKANNRRVEFVKL